MTTEQQERIIDILGYYGCLIGTDSAEISTLINQMQLINTSSKDATIEAQIKNLATYWSNQIGYEITDENNRCRIDNFVTKRDVICFKVCERFSTYGRIHYVLGDVFGKDRSSIYQSVIRSEERFRMNDQLFMDVYGLTLKEAA
jgi:hypothetical protein